MVLDEIQKNPAILDEVHRIRVLYPERCTFALVRNGREWTISEVKRINNLFPSPESVRAVARWFAVKNDNAREDEDFVPL
ncbi:hypothetical protein [Desulfonatronum thioautotrophicum]|uniref:hypothetical protein n=1 Tax=Desulfonatronum thioautotrophicum TaxID=617001 RepID=UPI0005EB23E6|nr:hypothetical protein [Desulfonatronum thioautotrophicum]